MASAVLFANPTAQSGRAAELIRRAGELLTAAGVEHEFIPTAPDHGTVGLVRRAVDEGGARLVISMGGDGTFAEVAKGVLAADHAAEVRLAVLPTGTANDQAKSFGMKAGAAALADNVAVIAAGATAELDVGRIQVLDEGERVAHSDLFFDSASIGFGADVLRARNRDRGVVAEVPGLRALYRDHMVYAGALLRRFLRTYVRDHKFDVEAEIDGRVARFEHVLDVIIKNTRVFGGEWVLTPDGEHDDGAFEVLPIAGRRDFVSKILATLRHSPIGEAELRKIGVEHSKPLRGSSITLTVLHPGAAEPPPAQIDGEELRTPGDKYRIDVLPRLLRVVVPRPPELR